jgi:hypothetical protein
VRCRLLSLPPSPSPTRPPPGPPRPATLPAPPSALSSPVAQLPLAAARPGPGASLAPLRAVAGRAGGALIRPPACPARPPGRGHTPGREAVAAASAYSLPSIWGLGEEEAAALGFGEGKGLGRDGREREGTVLGRRTRRKHHDVHPFRGSPAARHRGPAQ